MANIFKRSISRIRLWICQITMNPDSFTFGSDEGKYIVLPRGLREEILKKFDNAGISYKIEDKRTKRAGTQYFV